MMSEPFDPESVNDELLSAYLDGELSPKQVAQIEQWVSGSPSARRRLEDFRRLSGWLQELPRAELPSEFAAQVLREAERQMLLPAPAPRPTFSRRLRWWTLAVAAPLSAAAALLVTIQLARPPEGPPGDLARREGRPNSTEKSALAVRSATPAEANADRSGSAAAVASPAAFHAAGRAAAAPESALAADSSPADLARPVPVAAPSNLEDLAAGDKPLGGETEEIGAAEIAALVRRAREINDQGRTAVVRLFVIDRREGMELVQVVLDQNQIQRDATAPALARQANRKPEDPAAAPRAMARRSKAAAPATSHEGLFVVADVEKLTSALESLRARQESAVTWTLADSIEFDALDRPSRQRVDQALLAINAPSPTARMLKSKANPGESATAEKTDSLTEKSDTTLAARARSNPEPGGPATERLAVPSTQGKPAQGKSAQGKSAEPAPRARQVLVTVATPQPADVPENNPAAKSGGAKGGRLTRKHGTAPETGALAQSEGSVPTAPSPGLVRLILLIESKSLPER
jgi:hypothetical protein